METTDPIKPAESSASQGSDGIYVLRTTQQNQIQLNLLADQKANIIIGVTMIFFTLAIGTASAAGDGASRFGLPVILLGVALLGSFLLCVLSVTPKVTGSVVSRPEELRNPLFFGSFASVSEDDYIEFMLGRLRDSDHARALLIRDIHQTGGVLRRKYRLLRYSYIVLAVGVVAACAASVWTLFG